MWDRCQRRREAAKRGEAHRKTMSSLYYTHKSQTMLRIGLKWTTRHNLQTRKHNSNLKSTVQIDILCVAIVMIKQL